MSLSTLTRKHMSERRVRSTFTSVVCGISGTMCHGKENLVAHHQGEQVKNNQMALADSGVLPSTICCLSCHVFSVLFALIVRDSVNTLAQ